MIEDLTHAIVIAAVNAVIVAGITIVWVILIL